MPTRSHSYDAGVQFAIGWFLVALGAGAIVPRPGVGLASLIQASGVAWLWIAAMVFFGAASVVVSLLNNAPRLRFHAVVGSLLCWCALAFTFARAGLWGATGQACVAIVLLNGCAFRLFHLIRGDSDRDGV